MAVSDINQTEMPQKGLWGTKVSDDIKEQIKAREDLFAKECKTAEELLFLTSRTAWIALRSGVNYNNSKDIAERYTLLGGTSTGEEARKHINLKGQSGTYGMTEYGVRPMPGITGLNVSVKDELGSIQEAEIKIQVHSREDLEQLEKIFFVPGFPVLLEWGHTIYVDTKTKEVRRGSAATMMLPDEMVFQEQKLEELEREVIAQANKFCGNYVGLVGIVTNYSYSFQKKGTWECTLKVLGKGDLLNRIKAAKAEGVDKNVDKNKEPQDNPVPDIRIYQFCDNISKSIHTGSLGSVLSVDGEPLSSREVVLPGDFNPYDRPRDKRKLVQTGHKVSSYEVRVDKDGEFEGWEGTDFAKGGIYAVQIPVKVTWDTFGGRNFGAGTTENMTYIQLRDLLHVLNCDVVSRKDDSLPRFDLFSRQRYRTFSSHISLDPSVAILPKVPRNLTHIQGSLFGSPELSESLKAFTVLEGSTSDTILDIYVSAQTVMSVVNAIDSAGSSTSIQSILEEILRRVQRALGNINNFKIVSYPGTAIYYIIDANEIDIMEELPEICISGKRTTILNVDVQSRVSPEMQTMISIAGQSDLGKEKGSSRESSLYWWSKGRSRRWMLGGGVDQKKVNGTTRMPLGYDSDTEVKLPAIEYHFTKGAIYEKKSFDEFYSKLKTIYTGFFNATVKNVEKSEESPLATHIENQIGSVRTTGEDVFKRILNAISGDLNKPCSDGVIPVTVDLEMIGQGQFVMGTSFKVSTGVLPSVYDDWGFLITGVSHEVGKSGWITKLKTQYFVTREGKKKMQEAENPVKIEVKEPEYVEPVSPEVIPEEENKCEGSVQGYAAAVAEASGSYSATIPGTAKTGMCARGVRNLLERYIGGNTKTVYSGGANAGSIEWENILQNRGWKKEISKRVPAANIVSELQKITYYPGDIVNYRCIDGINGADETNPCRFGHTQMCLGINGRWMSDFEHSIFVYRKQVAGGNYPTWEFSVYRAPKKTAYICSELQDYYYHKV